MYNFETITIENLGKFISNKSGLKKEEEVFI
jgi:hypothetical protein